MSRQREVWMIYCPDIYPGSFVHLSILGEGYYLRAYVGPKGDGQRWKLLGVGSASELRKLYTFTHQIPVSPTTPASRNVTAHILQRSVDDRKYWTEETEKLNRKYSI